MVERQLKSDGFVSWRWHRTGAALFILFRMLTPKLRERLVVASQRLEDLNGKAVTARERLFLSQLAARKQQGQRRASSARLPAQVERGDEKPPRSIMSKNSVELDWEGLSVSRAPRLRPESAQAAGHALPRGNPRGAQPVELPLPTGRS